ncbi:unnamed protein product, partial [Urochloa humidicola]
AKNGLLGAQAPARDGATGLRAARQGGDGADPAALGADPTSSTPDLQPSSRKQAEDGAGHAAAVRGPNPSRRRRPLSPLRHLAATQALLSVLTRCRLWGLANR